MSLNLPHESDMTHARRRFIDADSGGHGAVVNVDVQYSQRLSFALGDAELITFPLVPYLMAWYSWMTFLGNLLVPWAR